MSEQATLQSIARSGHRKNFPLICRAAARRAASHSRLASVLSRGYGITISAPPSRMQAKLCTPKSVRTGVSARVGGAGADAQACRPAGVGEMLRQPRGATPSPPLLTLLGLATGPYDNLHSCGLRD